MKLQKLLLMKASLLLSLVGFAQKYTLSKCISTAITNNLQVQQSSINVKISEVNLKQSKDNRLPTINASTGQGLSFGRGIDPYTNAAVNQQIGFNNLGISSGVVVFNGWQQLNTIRQQEHLLNADKMTVEANKENLTLNVILAYLQVLSNQELLVLANNQIEVTQTQIQKTQKLITAGILPETNLIDLKAQLANDELTAVNAKNNLADAKLSLLQLMNLSPKEPLEVEPIEVKDIVFYQTTTEEVYKQALENQSFIKANQYRLSAAEKAIDIAKGIKYPVITFNTGLSTNYSSAARRSVVSGDIVEANTGLYVPLNGSRFPVMVAQPQTTVENIGYFSQMALNRNFSFNFQVRIPILNAYNVRNRMNLANLNRENLLYTDRVNRQQLRQNIEQAYNTMNAAFQRYGSIQKQVDAQTEAFLTAERKFDIGTINSMDYNLAKTNLDRAKLNLIQAKYDYLLRMRILDFYQNK